MIQSPISNINYRKYRITKEPTKAEKMLWDIGVPSGEDRVFRHDFFQKLPDKISIPIAKEYKSLYEKSGLTEANQYLLRLGEHLDKKPLKPNLTDSDICDFSRSRVNACLNIKSRTSDKQMTYSALSEYLLRYGISAPSINKKISISGAIKRMCSERWWRSKVRSIHGQNLEVFAIHAGFVHKLRGIYSSDETVFRKRQQKRRNNKTLEQTFAINDYGDELSLKELSDSSISNPKIRRAELMTRISGFEKTAQELGDVGMFYTMTCPSRMHARFSTTGSSNPKYDGTDPKEAQAHLVKMWSLIRTALMHQGIELYGIRVCEPHHDGTPHWHMMMFMQSEHVDVVTKMIQKYALLVDGNEEGAEKFRFDSKSIDWSKGTAAGYIAKYISKNIDGEFVGDDSYGKDAIETAERVQAWAGVWKIRQFQFVGGPDVGLWREVRRIVNPPAGFLGELFEAADNGDWSDFVKLMGGPRKSDISSEVSLLKVYSGKPNSYGEPLGYIVQGVSFNDLIVETRLYTWTIEFHPSQEFSRESFDIPGGHPQGPWENPGDDSPGITKIPQGQFDLNPRGSLGNPRGFNNISSRFQFLS